MQIGLLGFGTVGRGVYEIIAGREDMTVTRVLCRRDLKLPDAVVTHNFEDILNDPHIDTVVEAIGGLHPAYEYVRSAIGLLETGEAKLSQTRELQMGHLTIGASDTVTSQFLLPYLDSFHRQYPAIHIQIVSGRSHKVLGLLQSGKVDIAFASTPGEGSFETVPCFATHSIFVASPEYPCDFSHIYTLSEIADFPLILLERKASSRLYLEKYFLQNGLRLNPEIELGARSLLVDLAAIGFGVAGVTEEFVRKDLESGRLRKLETSFEIPPRSVDMCILRGVPQTAAAQRFADYIRGNVK